MATEPIILDRVPLRIDPAEVQRFVDHAGAAVGQPSDLEARLAGAVAAVAGAMRPRAVYRSVPVVEAGPDRLDLGGGAVLRIPGIGGHWGAVETVTAALVTIGAEVARLAPGGRDPVTVRLLDCVGSAAVECLAEWTNDHLCQQGVAAGQRVTNRISPGLAGWALAEQAILFELLPARAIGVRLRADGTMTPAKTVSLLVGAGRAARVDHYFAQCRRCWAEACPARRVPARGTVSAPPAGPARP
jgi:hypothetical protein